MRSGLRKAVGATRADAMLVGFLLEASEAGWSGSWGAGTAVSTPAAENVFPKQADVRRTSGERTTTAIAFAGGSASLRWLRRFWPADARGQPDAVERCAMRGRSMVPY